MDRNQVNVNFFNDANEYEPDSERAALEDIAPKDITPDTQLFQTIHMGTAIVSPAAWRLVVEGLVANPFSISLLQLQALPSTTVTTFHECYGSPITPPTSNLWRIGNVRWTGVRLSTLLDIAQPSTAARFIWSEGLESGTFASITADRYQKDLPITKALQSEVILAYALNDEPLSKERGFPVRLIVPGWFGTNSTKWICRISVRECRAPGPFTTRLYNEVDPHDPQGKTMRPVWLAEVNSMICHPAPGDVIQTKDLNVWGRAWGAHEVMVVEISIDGGDTWSNAKVQPRKEFEWQRFDVAVTLPVEGKYHLIVRATDKNGEKQPLSGRRNHVHSIEVEYF